MGMKILLKTSEDCCYLCGKRSTPLADRYPKNPEHTKSNDQHIRICVSCGKRIANIGAVEPALHA
jgi:hypothetical protein